MNTSHYLEFSVQAIQFIKSACKTNHNTLIKNEWRKKLRSIEEQRQRNHSHGKRNNTEFGQMENRWLCGTDVKWITMQCNTIVHVNTNWQSFIIVIYGEWWDKIANMTEWPKIAQLGVYCILLLYRNEYYFEDTISIEFSVFVSYQSKWILCEQLTLLVGLVHHFVTLA